MSNLSDAQMYSTSKPTIRLNPDPALLAKTTNIYELWRKYEIVAKGTLSPDTLATRWWVLKELISIIKKTDLTKIERYDLESFKATKLDSGCKPSTVKTYLSHISSFFQFIAIDIPMPVITTPRERITNIKKQVITAEEFTRLLEATDDLTYKAAFSILWERGLRIGRNSSKKGYPRRGLLGLNWGDIDFEKGTMIIREKGGDLDAIPLGELSEIYLKELKQSGNKGKIGPNDPPFVSRLGTRLSYEEFKHRLKKYMKYADIPVEKRHPHAFRHSCGTRLTKIIGVKKTQLVLGHKKLATTEIYDHIANTDLMQDLRPDKVQRKKVEEVEMKVCPKCDTNLAPDRKLCFVCGYDFTLHRCPECGRGVDEDANFCPYCTASIGIPRPECVCGYKLKNDFKVCPNCGRSTEEVKKLWDEKNLEKWSSCCTGKSEASFVAKSETESQAFELSNEHDEANLAESDPKHDRAPRANNCASTEPNFKRYQVQIVPNKEKLVELLEDDWELVKELSTREFVMRRRNNGHNDLLKR